MKLAPSLFSGPRPLSFRLCLTTLIISVSACSAQTTDDASTINLSIGNKSSENINPTSTNEVSSARPNILLIVVDDLGFMDIGANNPDTFYATPSIDAFAAKGVRFSQSYAANPVCSPSRLALLTGINPAKVDATDWFRHGNSRAPREGNMQSAHSINYMPSQLETIAEAAQPNFNTIFIGKWHLGGEETQWPEYHGFNVNIGGWSAGSPKGGFFAPFDNPRLSASPTNEYLTDRLTNEAIAQLQSNRDRPFLMVLSYYSVHVPLQAPDDLVAKYETRKKEYSQHQEFSTEEQVWPNAKNKRLVRNIQNHATYAAMVERMDWNIGRVLTSLQQLKLDNNTFVIITSDNGGLSTSEGRPTSNAPLRGGKGWMYDGGLKVPLLINKPLILETLSSGVESGRRYNHSNNGDVIDIPVTGTDVAATIFSMVGEPSKNIEGVSIFELLKDPEQYHNRALFWYYPHYSNQGGFPSAAIRLGRYKLIKNLENQQIQLFDLENDVGEQSNLAEILPQLRADLLQQLSNWMQINDVNSLRPVNKKSSL